MTNAIHHTLILGMASFDTNFFESRFLENVYHPAEFYTGHALVAVKLCLSVSESRPNKEENR